MKRQRLFLAAAVAAAFCLALPVPAQQAPAAGRLRQAIQRLLHRDAPSAAETIVGGRLRDFIQRLLHRNDPPVPPQPLPPAPVPPTPLPPAPVPPAPVPPPQPVAGLRVLIAGPEPRIVRKLTPEQAAILTSRALRDWIDASCAKDAAGVPMFRILPLTVDARRLDPQWQAMLALAPPATCSLVACEGERPPLIADLPADTAAALTLLADYAKKPATIAAAAAGPQINEPTPAQWREWESPTDVVQFGGKPRYLAAKPRDLRAHPYGSTGKTLAQLGVELIPRADWPRYLAAQKAANAGIVALTYGRVPVSDQQSTSYCWANAATNAGTATAYIQGDAAALLSAASVGCPVTGFRNVGGWPGDAIRYMQEHGAARASLWPNAAIAQSYWRLASVQADYPRHMVTEQIADLGGSGRIFDETVTCVLLGSPVAVSYDWWGHAVLAVGLSIDGGKPYLVLRNSWGADFGDQGFFKLREGRGNQLGTPDDAQAVLTMSVALPPYDAPSIDVHVEASVMPGSRAIAPQSTCPSCPGYVPPRPLHAPRWR